MDLGWGCGWVMVKRLEKCGVVHVGDVVGGKMDVGDGDVVVGEEGIGEEG